MSAPIKKVCLIGANGTLGSVILHELIKSHNEFSVSILQRNNSSSQQQYSAEQLRTISIAPELPLDELEKAFAGFDAVIASFPLSDVNQHLRAVEAAFRAGVRRYIPADYGSCDAASPLAQETLKLYRDKTMIRDKCESLAEGAKRDGGNFTWTSIICGHFFDFGLRDGLLHFDLEKHTAQLLDGGKDKASASTLHRVAEAVVAILERPDTTANKALYVQSFNPSQLEILTSLEKATKTTWQRNEHSAKQYLQESKQRVDDGDKHAIEDVVFALGTMDADWMGKEGFAMELLGLEDESLDEVVARTVMAYKKSMA